MTNRTAESFPLLVGAALANTVLQGSTSAIKILKLFLLPSTCQKKHKWTVLLSIHLLDKLHLMKKWHRWGCWNEGCAEGKTVRRPRADHLRPLSRGRAKSPTSAQCWGLPVEEGMVWCPMGCSGRAGHPGFSAGARESGCWLGTTVAGWHNGPSRCQCSAEEFGSHPSASSRKRVKKKPKSFKLISENIATWILKSES